MFLGNAGECSSSMLRSPEIKATLNSMILYMCFRQCIDYLPVLRNYNYFKFCFNLEHTCTGLHSIIDGLFSDSAFTVGGVI